jgi:uncharacterized membrane protein YeaQ/YmgE (transglycosylase-associated protein family)
MVSRADNAPAGRGVRVSRTHPQKGPPVLYLVPSTLADTVVATTDNDRGLIMSIVVWLVVGLVAGFLASKIINKRGEGVVMDIVLGLVGAMVGGFLIHLMGFHRNGSILWSIVVATLGAILVLVIYHKLIRREAVAR